MSSASNSVSSPLLDENEAVGCDISISFFLKQGSGNQNDHQNGKKASQLGDAIRRKDNERLDLGR